MCVTFEMSDALFFNFFPTFLSQGSQEDWVCSSGNKSSITARRGVNWGVEIIVIYCFDFQLLYFTPSATSHVLFSISTDRGRRTPLFQSAIFLALIRNKLNIERQIFPPLILIITPAWVFKCQWVSISLEWTVILQSIDEYPKGWRGYWSWQHAAAPITSFLSQASLSGMAFAVLRSKGEWINERSSSLQMTKCEWRFIGTWKICSITLPLSSPKKAKVWKCSAFWVISFHFKLNWIEILFHSLWWSVGSSDH